MKCYIKLNVTGRMAIACRIIKSVMVLFIVIIDIYMFNILIKNFLECYLFEY